MATEHKTVTMSMDRLERLEAFVARLAAVEEEVRALAEDAPLLDADLLDSMQGLWHHASGVLAQGERAARSEHALYEGAAEERRPSRLDRLFADLPARTLGTRLRRARLERGLTQKELAERVGVDWRQVQRWEDDGRRPRPAALARLADALGLRPATLLGPER